MIAGDCAGGVYVLTHACAANRDIVVLKAMKNHQSLRSSVRRAAAEVKPSRVTPASAHALSIASVTSSGAWRARYRRSTSLYNRLRDFLV